VAVVAHTAAWAVGHTAVELALAAGVGAHTAPVASLDAAASVVAVAHIAVPSVVAVAG